MNNRRAAHTISTIDSGGEVVESTTLTRGQVARRWMMQAVSITVLAGACSGIIVLMNGPAIKHAVEEAGAPHALKAQLQHDQLHHENVLTNGRVDNLELRFKTNEEAHGVFSGEFANWQTLWKAQQDEKEKQLADLQKDVAKVLSNQDLMMKQQSDFALSLKGTIAHQETMDSERRTLQQEVQRLRDRGSPQRPPGGSR